MVKERVLSKRSRKGYAHVVFWLPDAVVARLDSVVESLNADKSVYHPRETRVGIVKRAIEQFVDGVPAVVKKPGRKASRRSVL